MARTATGIDVGSRTTKALSGYVKGNAFCVTGFAFARHAGEGLAAAWDALEPDFNAVRARVGLSGRDVNVRYTRVPRVPDWQLRKLMRFEVEEIGDQSGASVASDFNLLPELPEIEGEDVVLLAMARESLLEEHARGLARIGGKLDCFTPSAVALYTAWVRYGVVEDDTVMVANIGHENIDVVIARGPDLLFARNLSGGVRLFDEALAQRFGVSTEKAEKLKRDFVNVAPAARHITPNHERASRSVLGAAGQLLSLLQSAVLFCKSQVKISGLKLDRLVLCGGGAALPGLPEYLSAGMGVSAERFDAFRVVDLSALDAEAAETLYSHRLECVVALGLATVGSDPDAYSLEILPEATARSRRFYGETAWLIAAAVLALAYLVFSGVWEARRLSEAEGTRSGVAARLRQAVEVHGETAALVEENAELSELALELSALAGSGEQLARMLAALDRHLPEDFWVTELESRFGHDPELGVERALERPILAIEGSSREGTDSPAVLHQGLMEALAEELPRARMKTALAPTGEGFSIDLTLFGPVPETITEAEPETGTDGGAGGS